MMWEAASQSLVFLLSQAPPQSQLHASTVLKRQHHETKGIEANTASEPLQSAEGIPFQFPISREKARKSKDVSHKYTGRSLSHTKQPLS